MTQILKSTLVLIVGSIIATGCTSDSVKDTVTNGGGSSSMNDTLTFSGGTDSFTVVWNKKYSQYSEVAVTGMSRMASSNTTGKVTISCIRSAVSGLSLSYSCEISNLSPGSSKNLTISEGEAVDWSVTYKETAAGSGYDTTEGPTQFTLVNNSGTLSKQ